MTEQKTVWVVHTNTDLNEGRGRQFIKHYCGTEATARRLGKGQYVQGGDCPVSEKTLVRAFNGWVDPSHIVTIEKATDGDRKVQARINTARKAFKKARDAGLSPEDIKALKELPNDQ